MSAVERLAVVPGLNDGPDPDLIGTLWDAGTGAPKALNLPDEFWSARPLLTQIRRYAWARCMSPDALLGTLLARASAATPHTYMLPGGVGSRGSLNIDVTLIGTSGTGKSTTAAEGRNLIPLDGPDMVDSWPISSGEGLADAFFEMIPATDDDGNEIKNKTVKVQTKRSVLAYADEGQAMMETGGRKGATLMMNLRQMWTGEVAGQGNAGAETKRVLAPRSYRFAVLVGFQPQYAMDLLLDAAGGTPQRFIFLSTTDPSLPMEPTPDPGPIPWDPLPHTSAQGIDIVTDFDVDPSIITEIRTLRVQAVRGEIVLPELDSHRQFNRLKIAALLATLERRWNVTTDDWHLAGIILTTSDTVRDHIAQHAALVARIEEEKRTSRTLRTEAAKRQAEHHENFERSVISVARYVHRHHKGEPIPRRLIQNGSSKATRLVDLDDVIEAARSRSWITPDGDGWRPGAEVPR